MLTEEKNRRQTASEALKSRLDAHICWLQDELAGIDKQLERSSSGVRPGVSGTSSIAVPQASVLSCQGPFWLACLSLGDSTGRRSQPWSGSHR